MRHLPGILAQKMSRDAAVPVPITVVHVALDVHLWRRIELAARDAGSQNPHAWLAEFLDGHLPLRCRRCGRLPDDDTAEALAWPAWDLCAACSGQ